MTLHWDGTTWSVVSSPAIQDQYLEFYGVSVLGPNDVWAVGYHKNYSVDITTLIAHWDGTAWTIVPSPNAATYNVLWGVAALDLSNVWAVGEQEEGNQVLIEHWDGTSWTIVSSAQTGGLYDIAARNANDIWAVGKADHAGHASLTMHWDGTTWSAVPGPGEGSNFTKLHGVIVTGTDSAWAAGTIAGTGAPYHSLIGHYYGSSPCLTPTPPLTNTPTATLSPTAQPTNTATPIPTTCAVAFADVPVGSAFYDDVRCLACRGIIGGYPCGGPGEPCPGQYFRPGNQVTRGQPARSSRNRRVWPIRCPAASRRSRTCRPPAPSGSTSNAWRCRGIIGGYPCGGPGEPCVAPGNRPYFRPNSNVTRGQLAKIVSGTAGWTETPTGQTFEDVAPGSPFYLWIERMASRGDHWRLSLRRRG